MPDKTILKLVTGIHIILCCIIFGFIQSAFADHFMVTVPSTTQGICFIESLFGSLGVIDLLFFLGLLVIIITCHISIRKPNKRDDD